MRWRPASGPLAKGLNETKTAYPTAQWGLFLRNHDELDLGRLEPEQRQRVFDEFGPEKAMQLYDRGIRRRLAPMLKADRRRLELAYSLMFTLPGTPVMRYGDEIAMGDDLKLPERYCARTPMQWSNRENGGFSTAEKTYLPAISGGAFGFETVNVADQRRDPQSLLNWMERIIRMRQEVPEIGWGEYRVLPVKDPAVLALRYEWRENVVVFLHNFDVEPKEVAFRAGGTDDAPATLSNLLDENHSEPGPDGRHHVVLEGYGYRWFRLGGLDDILKRSEA